MCRAGRVAQDGCPVEKWHRDVVHATGDEGCAGEVGGAEMRQYLAEHLRRECVDGGHGCGGHGGDGTC